MSLIIACLNLHVAGIDQPFSATVASLAVPLFPVCLLRAHHTPAVTSGLLCISLTLLTNLEPLELKSVPVDQAGNIELRGDPSCCSLLSPLSLLLIGS